MGKEKLVRDKMPEISKINGRPMNFRVASPDEHLASLFEKLIEETLEAKASSDTTQMKEELADVMEVIKSIATIKGLSLEEIEQIREAKEKKRGGLLGGIIWDGNR